VCRRYCCRIKTGRAASRRCRDRPRPADRQWRARRGRISAPPADCPTLWPVLVVKAGSKDHISAEIVRQLNAYRDHLNASFGTKDAPVIPPGSDGLPWRITTRQFRRTIAWHIANRPFGTIAGMIQYKHASVAAFEGYAGSSRSGFRAEVEAQRVLGQLDRAISLPISTSTAPVRRSPVQPVPASPRPWRQPPTSSVRSRR
jgi:hypothetical protein